MAANTFDFKVIGPVGGGQPESTSGSSVKDSAVASGTTASISPGDLCIYADGYWAKVADGEANADGLYGIADSTSTETSSADGLVKVKYHPSGLKIQGTPTTVGNLAQGILGDLVTLDVDGSGNQTVDENDTTNGVLRIVDYDDTSGEETITVVAPWNSTPA